MAQGESLRKFQPQMTAEEESSVLSSLEDAEARADEFRASWGLSIGYVEDGSSSVAQVYGNDQLYKFVIGLRALFDVNLGSRRHRYDPNVLFWWPGSMCEPRRRGKWQVPSYLLSHSDHWKWLNEALDDCRVRRGVVL